MEYRLPLAQLAQNVACHPNRPYLHQPHNREWSTYTWSQFDENARRIAKGLTEALEPGDKVAILAKNSAEWFMLDMAIMMAGMVSVPIYATAGTSTISYILQHSEARAVFVGKLDSTDAAEAAIPDDMLTVVFPYPTIGPGTGKQQRWQDWLVRNQPLQRVHEPQPDDMATLVYTSGSTGRPKGVVLSFRNLASSAYCSAQLEVDGAYDRTMSYLPLAHITERCVIELMSLYAATIEVFFVESLDTFIEDVRHAQPSMFLSVPRLWTKFQTEILAKLPQNKLNILLRIPVINKLIKRKIKQGLGLDKTLICGSGSAPISPAVLRWYASIGIDIAEGWGMTETSGLSCSNLPYEAMRLGSIGVPVDCVEMKLSDEGEILIRGEAVFSEYYKNPEATAEAFVDGWFRTGDRADKNPDGSWKIIGRVKEQFKTGKGKYVAPVPIESQLARNSDIEQVCVLGSGRKHPIAIVVLAEQCRGYNPVTEQRLQNTLDEVNSELESHARLDHIVVSDTPWTIENELLTPTMKIKRNKLEERYGHYLTEELEDTIVWEKSGTTDGVGTAAAT